MMRAMSKMRHKAFLFNGAIHKVVLSEVLLLFPGKLFQIIISRKRRELAQYLQIRLYRCWYLPSNEASAKTALWQWHTLTRSRLQIVTKMFLQICLRLYGTRHRDRFLPVHLHYASAYYWNVNFLLTCFRRLIYEYRNNVVSISCVVFVRRERRPNLISRCSAVSPNSSGCEPDRLRWNTVNVISRTTRYGPGRR